MLRFGCPCFACPAWTTGNCPWKTGAVHQLEAYFESPIHTVTEPDFEAVWLEQHYVDAEHQREARFRIALARGQALCLISFNYWTNRAATLEPVVGWPVPDTRVRRAD
jgi:hypothetical protein